MVPSPNNGSIGSGTFSNLRNWAANRQIPGPGSLRAGRGTSERETPPTARFVGTAETEAEVIAAGSPTGNQGQHRDGDETEEEAGDEDDLDYDDDTEGLVAHGDEEGGIEGINLIPPAGSDISCCSNLGGSSLEESGI